jgi:hypothetical protein
MDERLTREALAGQGITRGRPERTGHDLGGVSAIVGKPVEGGLHVPRRETQHRLERTRRRQLAGRARGRDRGTTTVGLKSDLQHTSLAYAQEEPREVTTAGILLFPYPIGYLHEPGVAGPQEVIQQGGAVAHAPQAAPTGNALRSLATSGSTRSSTYSMSSGLVERPSEHRTAPMAQSTGTPMATST